MEDLEKKITIACAFCMCVYAIDDDEEGRISKENI
jgi:hypothetical protein